MDTRFVEVTCGDCGEAYEIEERRTRACEYGDDWEETDVVRCPACGSEDVAQPYMDKREDFHSDV
jgi:DNA-directed RNA polymerase subunit RPC12/RpoP